MNEARTIERTPIDSSNLAAVGYDPDRQVLSVEFTSGSVFHYYSVTLDVFEAFGAAESRGQFYAKQIRGKFLSRAMTGKCPDCLALGFIGEVCSRCEGGREVREVDHTHKG